MLKALSLSIATSLLLAQTPLNYEALSVWNNAKKEVELSNYKIISENALYSLKNAIRQICDITTLENAEALQLKGFLEFCEECKKEALRRVKKNNLECDKFVLYSLFTITHILEALLDKDFFTLTGGYKMPLDILEFGKNLYDIS